MRRTIIFISIASYSFQAAAQTSPPPPMAPISAPSISTTFGANNQYYELSVQGVGKFMEALKVDEPTAYTELQPAYDDLVFQRNLAWGSAIGGVAVGALMVTSGISDLENKGSMFTAGIFTIMAAPSLYFLFRPGHEDFLDFINQHNRLKRSDPIRIGLNTSPSGRGLSLSLSLQL